MITLRHLSPALAAAALLALGDPGAARAQPARAATTSVAVDGRELTADQQVRHVLDRLGFGARPGDVERVRAMGVDRWIALQLEPRRLADPAGDALAAHYPLLALSTPALFEQVPPPQLLRRLAERQMAGGGLSAADSAELQREIVEARRASARILDQLQSARVARAVVSERQLEEVLVDFWANHFSVFAGKGPFGRHHLVAFERDAIRPHALGRFRDLLGAVARSPAMLLYLDNAQSQAAADAPRLGATRGRAAARRAMQARARRDSAAPPPRAARGLNENYARELLELHTLGVDGGYTQQDVIEVARALTGWTVEGPQQGGGFVFRPALHDAGAKTVLGTRLAAGRGIEDGEQVLDLVARHPATARFIAGKLARRFVSDAPPDALVERAAQTFRRTDGDLREVVRTIVTSPEFFAREAYRAKVKAPFELVVSALRAVGAEADPSPRTAQVVARLGQPIYGRETPNGWPETGDAWINTGAIVNRINFGLALAGGAVPGAAPRRWPVARELAGAPREAQVDGIAAALLGGELSPDTRQVLLSGENPLLARDGAAADGAAADSAAMRAPADAMRPDAAGAGARRRAPGDRAFGRVRPPEGVALVLGLALGAPEFQRR